MTEGSSASTDLAPIDDLKLMYAGGLVEQLGAQLYPSATATVAELISNAWDANAQNVWVSMPFGDWKAGEIVVLDDGHGMTLDEARRQYLIVGRRRRREQKSSRTEGDLRPLHGRKGIGKLAAFGTAGVLEVKTRRPGEPVVAFRLEYDAIRTSRPDQPYQVQPSQDQGALERPDTGEELANGTRVRLTDLRLKRRLDDEAFMRSMSRRFALSRDEMRVFINGRELQRFEVELDVHFPRDDLPPEARRDDGWAVESLSDGSEVRWWIGFTEKPLRGEAEQGISVLARGKLAQRPFKFERFSGTTGQLGQEYLVGEVQADWLDQEKDNEDDAEDDLIQSNRDALQLENEQLELFLDWGRKRVSWALARRNKIRSSRATRRFEAGPRVDQLLKGATPTERRSLSTVAEALAELPEVDEDRLVDLMTHVMGARETSAAKELTQAIELEGDPQAPELWRLLAEVGVLDARRAADLVRVRVETLEQLIASGGELADSPDPAAALQDNLWLIDPRWDLLQPRGADGLVARDGSLSAVLAPSPPGEIDELLAVVIATEKGTTDAAGPTLERLAGAVDRAREGIPGTPVRVLVIADPLAAWTSAATDALPDQPVDGRSWEQTLRRSQDLHRGWLDVLQARASRAEAASRVDATLTTSTQD